MLIERNCQSFTTAARGFEPCYSGSRLQRSSYCVHIYYHRLFHSTITRGWYLKKYFQHFHSLVSVAIYTTGNDTHKCDRQVHYLVLIHKNSSMLCMFEVSRTRNVVYIDEVDYCDSYHHVTRFNKIVIQSKTSKCTTTRVKQLFIYQ